MSSPDSSSSSSSKKKLELQTFLDLTRDNQIKFILYFIGALILLMLGISGLTGISGEKGMNIGAILIAAVGIGGGGWLGYNSYTLLLDPKNAKKCNAAFWAVTENIGFDKTDSGYKSDLGITLCKAQIKAEYDGYAGFYCVSNTETEGTVDAYYINLSDSKKLTLKESGTSNVFTIKSGDNKITVIEPPGSFTLKFTNATRDSVTIQASSFARVDETRNATVTVNPPQSTSPSPTPAAASSSSVTIQQLKDGFTISNGPFESLTTFDVTVYSTTRDGLAVTKSLRLSYSPPPGSPSSPISPQSP